MNTFKLFSFKVIVMFYLKKKQEQMILHNYFLLFTLILPSSNTVEDFKIISIRRWGASKELNLILRNLILNTE